MLRYIKKSIKIVVFGIIAILCSFFEKPTNISIKQARKEIESLRPYPAKKSYIINLPTDSNIDISIIVPVYNTEKYVKKCVDSILEQQTSYTMQIILIDDGSTDSCPQILESYRQLPHVQIIHQSNGGLSAARNAGLNCARGKYVMFIDSDDFIPAYAIDTLVKIAYSTNAEIVQGNHRMFTSENKIKVKSVPQDIKISKLNQLDEKMKLYCFAWNKVYLRSIFEEIRWPERFLFEDIMNCLVIYQISGVAVTIPTVTYFYRINNEGIMHTHLKDNKTLDVYWIMVRLYEQREKMGIPITNSDYLFLLNQLCTIYRNRLRKYPMNILKDIFALSCEFLEQHQPQEQKKLTYRQRMIEQSLLRKKFIMWRACSRMV